MVYVYVLALSRVTVGIKLSLLSYAKCNNSAISGKRISTVCLAVLTQHWNMMKRQATD